MQLLCYVQFPDWDSVFRSAVQKVALCRVVQGAGRYKSPVSVYGMFSVWSCFWLWWCELYLTIPKVRHSVPPLPSGQFSLTSLLSTCTGIYTSPKSARSSNPGSVLQQSVEHLICFVKIGDLIVQVQSSSGETVIWTPVRWGPFVCFSIPDKRLSTASQPMPPSSPYQSPIYLFHGFSQDHSSHAFCLSLQVIL